MAPTQLEVTVLGADDLKNISAFSGKMDLYVVLYVDPAVKLSTRILRKAGRNPVWNDTVILPLGSLMQRYASPYLSVEIFCQTNGSNKVVGFARLLLQEIYRLCHTWEGDEPALATLQLQRPVSGRPQGTVMLSMKLGGDVGVQDSRSTDATNKDLVVMGIPVSGPNAMVPYSNQFHHDGTTATGYPSLSGDSPRDASSSSSGMIPYAYPAAYCSYPQGYIQPAPPPPHYQQVPYAYVQPPQPQRSSTTLSVGSGLILGLLTGAVGGLLLT